jgi:hypothetical protein
MAHRTPRLCGSGLHATAPMTYRNFADHTFATAAPDQPIRAGPERESPR